jgi:hypothetical protein
MIDTRAGLEPAPVVRRAAIAARLSLVLALLLVVPSVVPLCGDEPPPADKPAAKAAPAADAPRKKLDEKALRQKLLARTDLKVDKSPLGQVLEKLGEQHEIPIRIDAAALKRQGVTRNQLITVSVTNFALREALKHILKPLNLQFQVADGEILVTDAEAEEVAKPAQRPPGAPVPVAVVAADEQAVNLAQQQQQQQFSRQFRTIASSELHLARAVCEPTAEQLEALREDVEQSLKESLQQQTERQKRTVAMRRGQQHVFQIDLNSSAKLARDAVARAVKARLSSEQADRFNAELAQRAVDRREAAAHNFVARLDQELVFSAEQRSQVTAALLARWDDSWCQSLQMFIYDEQSLPNLPEPQIVKFLSPAQKKIWLTIPKNQGNVVFGGGFMGGLLGEDIFADVEGDPPDGAAREE